MSLKEYKRLRAVHLINAIHLKRVLRHPWLDAETRAALTSGRKREQREMAALRRRFFDQHALANSQSA